jgi:hypothetical protein
MARRSFSRPVGKKRYKKMFVIATEGAKTEPIYFGMFNDGQTTIHVKQLKGKNKSAPKHVLARMKKHLADEGLRASDEAWLVVDTDQWSTQGLNTLHLWSTAKHNHGLAVSNPKFEYWLLLHFEDGNGVSSSSECTTRLKSSLPSFGKACLDADKVRPGVQRAIDRAKKRDNRPCAKWPQNTGTTVYKLVERLV